MQTIYGLGIAVVGIALMYLKISFTYGGTAFLVGITMALGPKFIGGLGTKPNTDTTDADAAIAAAAL